MKKYILIILIQLSCINNKSNDNIKDSTDLNNESKVIINKPTINNPLGKIKNLHFGCGFNKDINRPDINLNIPNQREINEIQNILFYSGIPMNFEVYSANIENAVATIIKNKRYIIYDPKLLKFADRNSNSYWNSMSILAHEIGHHLSGHTMKNDIDSHKRELEADKFSGFILFKMGASVEQATYTISVLGSEEDSNSHPSKYKRIEAIKNGWNEANSQLNKSAIPPSNEFNNEIVGLEFTIEDFYSKEEIIENNYEIDELGPFTGYVISNKLENDIIISMIIEITELPKINGNQLPFMFRKNKRIEIYLLEPEYASNALRGYFEYVIKPGNKLMFKIHQEGNGNYPYPNYIKVLPRN
jgi:hypothetical protein